MMIEEKFGSHLLQRLDETGHRKISEMKSAVLSLTLNLVISLSLQEFLSSSVLGPAKVARC
jgi:hypothetical protein